jgi:hypothetical protein
MAVLFVALATASAYAQAQRQVLDISGVYNRFNLITEERAILINAVGGGAQIGDYTGFPLNDAGRQWADSWMAARIEMPEHQCHPHPTQYANWGPGNFRIANIFEEHTDRIIGMRIEGTFGRADRIVWLDGRPHPPEWARHTWAGFSTGQWDGNQLTIETTHLKEGWFSRNGIMASDKTTMREHWVKHDNYLTIVFILNDPEHLEEPFIRTTHAVLDPTTLIAAAECQPFNTTVMNPGHARDYVPHWLPGQNPQIAEFAEKWGVPPDAARGGARTLYPEYMAEIRKWVATRVNANGSR